MCCIACIAAPASVGPRSQSSVGQVAGRFLHSIAIFVTSSYIGTNEDSLCNGDFAKRAEGRSVAFWTRQSEYLTTTKSQICSIPYSLLLELNFSIQCLTTSLDRNSVKNSSLFFPSKSFYGFYERNQNKCSGSRMMIPWKIINSLE